MIKDLRLTPKGMPERCFVLKDDIAATIVIPFKKLMPVDYQRLKAIQAKGGEMLKAMRDETLENGRNALKQYEPLIDVIYKPSWKKDREEREREEEEASYREAAERRAAQESESEQKEAPRRGPGRPRGSKNKKKSEKGSNDN